MNWLLLFWPAFCILLAYMQGVLMPAIRRTPPGAEAKKQAFGLHTVGAAAYLLPLVLLPSLVSLAVAVGSRLILFDPVLNTAAGRPWLEVGQTAASDRLLRKLSPTHPERLSLLLRVGGSLLLAAVALFAL